MVAFIICMLTFNCCIYIYDNNLNEDEDCNEKDETELAFADEPLEEMNVNSFFTYSIVDELISVALAKKIVSKEVSAEFAFSIN